MPRHEAQRQSDKDSHSRVLISHLIGSRTKPLASFRHWGLDGHLAAGTATYTPIRGLPQSATSYAGPMFKVSATMHTNYQHQLVTHTNCCLMYLHVSLILYQTILSHSKHCGTSFIFEIIEYYFVIRLREKARKAVICASRIPNLWIMTIHTLKITYFEDLSCLLWSHSKHILRILEHMLVST